MCDFCSGVASETDDSVYDRLIRLVNDAIMMMYGGITPNPVEEQRAAMLIYLVARICNEIAKTAPRPSWLTAILFHGSGVIAVEALLWVMVGQLSGFIISNVPILLVALFCCCKDICELLNVPFRSILGLNTADQMPQEGMNAEVTEINGNQATD